MRPLVGRHSSAVWFAEQPWLSAVSIYWLAVTFLQCGPLSSRVYLQLVNWLAVSFLLCDPLSRRDYLQFSSTGQRWLLCSFVPWVAVITCNLFPLVISYFFSVARLAAVITCNLRPLGSGELSRVYPAEQAWLPAVCFHWLSVNSTVWFAELPYLPAICVQWLAVTFLQGSPLGSRD